MESSSDEKMGVTEGLMAFDTPKKKVIVGVVALLSVAMLFSTLVWLFLNISKFIKYKDAFLEADFGFHLRVGVGLFMLLVVQSLIYLVLRFVRKYKNRALDVYIAASSIFIIVLLLMGLRHFYIKKHPNLQAHNPEYNQNLLDYTEPIEVIFNVPVRTSKLKPSVTPEFEGEWKWEPYLGMESITRKGTFYPEVSAFPEARFVVYIAGVNKLSDTQEHEYGFVFRAPKLPSVTSTSPKDQDKDVQRNQQIILEVDKSSQDLVDWEFKIEPDITFDTQFTDNNEIVLTPQEPYEQGENYQFSATYKPKRINLESGEVIQTGESVTALDMGFTTVKEPLVEEFNPSGKSVLSDENINVIFEEPFDQESLDENFEIKPAVKGEIVWKSDKHFTYELSEPLKKDTQYTVTFKKGAKSLSGGELEKDITFNFTTIGRVEVSGISPQNGASGVSESAQIKVTFNQKVDHTSAQAHFSISPAVSGAFSWSGNSMTYTLSKSLNFETKYTVTVKSGVKSVDGLDSNKDFSYTFTTKSNSFVFQIPIYYQPTGFACNIFTAKMILGWKGISANYVDLIAEIGYNDNQENGTWTGNPYKEYIGNADGTWGYGVYYPPIRNILSARGIQSTPHVGWNKVALAKAVEKGNPVIIWRYNGVGGGQDISWTASDGTHINAFNGMHGTVITGFIGSSDNPTSFYLNDPWLGQFWMPASTLDGYWSYSNRMALEVIK